MCQNNSGTESITHLSKPIFALPALLLAWSALAVAADVPKPESAPTPPASSSLLGGLSFGSQRDPIEVTADRMELDYRSRVLTYAGNVVVTQADLKLESDTLRVVLDTAAQSKAEVKEVVASGNVRMRKGTRWATSGRAIFDNGKRTITLRDNAILHDDANQVRGESVVVYLDEERSVVEGGKGRVQAVLYPKRDEEKKEVQP